ncbi:MAG TPA: AAA family ATPase [Croceibacterium sp.]|nr:AAA family ATPase [Croceibacterium sp.]
MTDQSKIPLPGEGNPAGQSLFERAEGAFGGFQGFQPAPVPAELAAPANRRVSRRAAETEATVAAPASPSRLREGLGVGQPDDARRPTPAPSRKREGSEAESPAEPIAFTMPRQAIERSRLQRHGMIVPDGAVTTLFEEFRIVKRQVLLAARETRSAGHGAAAQRVLVSSPLPGEGKTFCATNLALAIAAEKDSEVLLVDADFAKPSILSLLGLSGATGLMDALADPAIRVEDCVIPTDVPGLHVLPAGNRTASDSEYLASERTSEVLDRLTQGTPNRIVIFDSPPALAASPAAELAPHVGQALVICRADQTGQSALEDALSLLSTCPDIKLLLNSAHFSPSGRRFGTYYGYGG